MDTPGIRPTTNDVNEAFEDWLRRAGYEESRTVEKLMEHLFLAEVLQECWFRRRQVVEVLHAEVDAAGYDIVLEAGGQTRHVQLKASHQRARTAKQTISTKLPEREGGCVVWVSYSVDEVDGRAKLSYRWRDSQERNLPSTPGRNPRTGRVRPKTAVLKRSDFETIQDTATLVHRLFGPAQR
jgi:hypothetical protein